MVRRVSMATRDEILGALVGRYAAASREEKGRLITELAALRGYHRQVTAPPGCLIPPVKHGLAGSAAAG